jgi:IMP and pyridine-specific 5'-nucleotidase
MTFDGDETLYRDGMTLTDPEMAALLTDLIKNDITVAIVTAAGYGYDNTKYEARLVGLLEYFQQAELPEEVLNRFHVLGGECNYLFRCGKNPETGAPVLNAIHATEWFPTVASWEEQKIQRLLDVAEECFRYTVSELRMRARVIRKPRSVGVISENLLTGKRKGTPLRRESLDETVLRVQMALKQVAAEINIPYCAFNGGQDVWVDCGNKRVGVDGLQAYLGLQPEQCLHIGDQFLNTGNDFSARDSCPCTWIAEPAETKYIIRYILRQLKVYPARSDSETDLQEATAA